MTEDTTNTFQGSPQQDEQWRREPEGPSGRTQAIVGLDGPLDVDRLADALRTVSRRHESLRTTFVRQPGISIPVQAVHDQLEPGWDTVQAPVSDERDQVASAVRRERERPVDFEQGPLVRALLMGVGARRHVLILTMPTLCADTASIPVLVGDLAHHYGAAIDLAEDPLQYADFAAWQVELSDSQDDEALAARQIWSELADAEAPTLPFTHSSMAAFAPEDVPVAIASSSSPELVHAAWCALLGRLAGAERVITAFMSPDRRHPELSGAIGAFARPVPFSTEVVSGRSFEALLTDVSERRSHAAELQDYAPPAAPTGLTVGFSDYERPHVRAGELSISLERIATTGHPWRLWLSCPRDADTAVIHFDPAVYERGSVHRLGAQLATLIGAAVTDRDRPIDALQLLDEDQRHEILTRFNETAAPVDSNCVHELFAAHARAAPARDAVVDERGAISYSELDSRANQLAHRLRASGVGPDVPVGLCTDRSVDMVIGLLGILKAGGAYVPLNYEHPPMRLGHQLATAGAQVIVTQERLLSHLPASDREVICLDGDADRASLDAEPATAPAAKLSGANLAYVIYTSGSTGAPKGVGVTHGNLANYVADITRRFGADSEALAFGLVTSISTDLGNTSVFGALGSGGTLVLLSPAASADAGALARQLEHTPVDVLKITPSHLGALLAGDDAAVLPRAAVVIGGERAPWDLVAKIRRISSCAIFNHYGPTETTIGCCIYAVDNGAGPYEPATVPIGRPIANTSCYVVDDHLAPVPIGVAGRLFVGGAGVASGYVGQPDLTAELFIADPFAGSPSARMYSTGDLARWLPDGTLEFLGRSDDQVKVRGYRVEPAEIESALRSHVDVSEAVVVTSQSASGERRLVAYCTMVRGAGEDRVRGHLTDILPEFMIPSAILTLDSMPRTPSGKIDRISLPDPSTLAESAGPAHIAPRTPVEKAIAAVWAQTLGVERIGVEDDFFELGGHSLLATQVVAQVRSEFDVDLPLHSLFTCPTVELLAAEIVQLMGSSEQDETAKLLAELEGLSDEEAERLLTEDLAQPKRER